MIWKLQERSKMRQLMHSKSKPEIFASKSKPLFLTFLRISIVSDGWFRYSLYRHFGLSLGQPDPWFVNFGVGRQRKRSCHASVLGPKLRSSVLGKFLENFSCEGGLMRELRFFAHKAMEKYREISAILGHWREFSTKTRPGARSLLGAAEGTWGIVDDH